MIKGDIGQLGLTGAPFCLLTRDALPVAQSSLKQVMNTNTSTRAYSSTLIKQEAFEKCWAHSLSANRRYIVARQL